MTRSLLSVRNAAVAFAACLVCVPPVCGVQTRTWTVAVGELQTGESDGVAVTDRGRLFLAPRLSRLGGEGPLGGAAHVWSVAADSRANLYLGTGPEGRVLKLGPTGPATVLFSVPEPMVTALAVLPDGDLLAGTAPAGKIYRVRPDGKGELWCETGETYVWSLAVGRDGSVFAGTGERGILFRIDRTGHPFPFFDSDEAHLTTVLALGDGSLVAGGAGRGLVYHISPDRTVKVLFDADLPEISDLATEADGSIVAALVAPPEAEPRPPAVRIEVPQGAAAGAAARVGEIGDGVRPTIEGVIEGMAPSQEARPARRLRGRVVRIAKDGAVREIWKSTLDAPLSLLLDAEQRVVFGTGEPGRLYRVGERDEVEMLGTLREGQVSGLVRVGGAILVATSNPASAHRLERSTSDHGSFVSRPFDAQAPSRWGTVRWRAEGVGPGNVAFQARSGNSAEPDGTWSDWGPPIATPSEKSLGVPDGRFLQWRLTATGEAAAQARLGEVSITYTTLNRPPAIENFRLDSSQSAVRTTASFRWSASDPDGDPVSVEVRYRRTEADSWNTAVRVTPPAAPESGAETDSWKDGKATWETTEVPEGIYEVQAVVSDQPWNAAGEGEEARSEPGLTLTIDRTAPEIEARRETDGSVRVSTRDRVGTVRRLELLDGDRVLASPSPDDGVCDSPEETFRIDSRDVVEAVAKTLRVTDAAGNSATREVPAR